MIIVTTPMCKKILELGGLTNFKVNKNPDNESGDLAILLSENKTKMPCLNIKLNTFSQIAKSIITVSEYGKYGKLSDQDVDNLLKDYKIPDKFKKDEFKSILSNKASKIRVKVISNFIKDIVEDIGFKIVDKDYEYLIFPDYYKDKDYINNTDYNLIELPTHNNVSLDPIKRTIARYSLLDDIINTY